MAISKQSPIPFTITREAPVGPRGKDNRWPFRGMAVGDAMAVRFPVPLSVARSAAWKWARRHGWTFKSAEQDGVKVIVRIA